MCVFAYELQQLGIAPPGNPKLLFNMIRLSSGGLLALGNELKGSSGTRGKALLDDPDTGLLTFEFEFRDGFSHYPELLKMPKPVSPIF